MKLSQLMKKGYVQVEKIDEEITRLCSAYGILKEKRLYMTGISANGYSVVICDERLMALPQWLCRGISV